MADRASQKSVDVTIDDVRVLNVVDLLVDEDNFRMEPNSDQPAALKAMLRRQGKKLARLAESLIYEGPSRGEFVWVAPDPRPEHQKKYVVCEGNRRVSAIKLLNEPALAEGTSWAARFRELAKDFQKGPILQVRAIVYPSLEEARPDVYRRHTNDQDGAGLEAWDPFAQDRANKAQQARRNLSMVALEQLTPTTIEAYAEQLGIFERTTNADRLLSTFSKSRASRYGIKLSGTFPYKVEFGPNPDLGAEILREILRKADVPVDLIKSEPLRLAKLDELLSAFDRLDSGADAEAGARGESGNGAEGEQPDAHGRDNRSQSGGSTGDGGAGASNGGSQENGSGGGGIAKGRSGGRRPKKDPLDRQTLAPTDQASTLHVHGPRLTGLYRECLNVIVDERPNASAMLLRVFLELSCEAYLRHEHVRPAEGRANWGDHGIRLDTKVKKVLGRLDPERKDRDLVDAWNGCSEDGGYSHSIRSLHRAMHDLTQVLDPREIKLSWQRWHPLLTRMHDVIRP